MPIAMSKGGTAYYLAYDPVGSLRIVSDAAGNIVKRVDYDSFGNILADSNPALTVPFGFAGGLHDPATGLVRFGYRDYDPDVGRWTAKDPILFAGGDTDLFGYVQSDPVNMADPLGLLNILAGGGASATAITGAEGSAGIVVNPGIGGSEADAGLFGSLGAGGGLNISADVFLGYVEGDITNVSGVTANENISAGPLSVSVFIDTKTGEVVGGTIGIGPGALPAGISGTISKTGMLTLRDLLDRLSKGNSENPCQ
jgi:RHS repeat-associated protein